MLNHGFYISNKEIATESKDCLRGSWKVAALTTFVFCLFMIVALSITILTSIFVEWWFSIPFGILTILLFGIFHYGYSQFCLSIARQETPYISELFSGFSKKIGGILKLIIKKFFLLLFWLVVFIVPFFVKAIAYSMSTLLMIDKGLKSDVVIKESKHIMKQNYGRYLKFVFSNILWFLLVLISAGIAIIWVAPKFMTGKALFYENLKTEF